MLRIRKLFILGLFLAPFFIISCNSNQDDNVASVKINKLSIYPVEGKAPLKVTFQLSISNIISKSNYSINWDFDGDGKPDKTTVVTDLTQEWVYNSVGTFNFIIEILEKNKVILSKKGVIRVKRNLPPVIDSFQVVPENGTVPLHILSHIEAHDPDTLPGGDGIVKTEWDVNGDGEYDLIYNNFENQIYYTFNSPGLYRVSVKVTDDMGDYSFAGPVTVTVMLPLPSVSTPDKQIWHAGVGFVRKLTTETINGKKYLFVADGIGGIVVLLETDKTDDYKIVGKYLAYTDGEVYDLVFVDNILLATVTGKGIYAYSVTAGGVLEPVAEPFFSANVDFIVKWQGERKNHVIAQNKDNRNLIITSLENGTVNSPSIYSLTQFSNYVESSGGNVSRCGLPLAQKMLIVDDKLLLLLKNCIWQLDLNDISNNVFNMSNFKYFDLHGLASNIVNGIYKNHNLYISDELGLVYFNYYPDYLTKVISVSPDNTSGIFSKNNYNFSFFSDDMILQSGNKNYLYSVTSQGVSYSGYLTDYTDIIFDLTKINQSYIFAVGDNGIYLYDKRSNFIINDKLSSMAFSEINGKKLLYLVEGAAGINIIDVDDFTYPKFITNFRIGNSIISDLYLSNSYGWIVTSENDRFFISHIKLDEETKFLEISRLSVNNSNGFIKLFPLGLTDIIAVNYENETAGEINQLALINKKGILWNTEMEFCTGIAIVGNYLFVGSPGGVDEYLWENINSVPQYKDFVIPDPNKAPNSIGGLNLPNKKMLFIGAVNRLLYGYAVDDTGLIYDVDGYPLFAESGYYSTKIIFQEMLPFNNYFFLSLMEGGIGIFDSNTAGVMMYDSTNLTKKIINYPDSQDPVKIITQGKFQGNSGYNLIKFLKVNGLSYH